MIYLRRGKPLLTTPDFNVELAVCEMGNVILAQFNE